MNIIFFFPISFWKHHEYKLWHFLDFGHFLGNFKYKFGIRRERVPILLSSEFIEVIRTDEFGRQRNFENFRNLCERAYLTLRRNGCLLISLLAMMISTGLPELSSEQDVNIVRSTLNLDRSEEEALENFKHEFDESLRNAWKISLDWWFHMMNQTRTNRATWFYTFIFWWNEISSFWIFAYFLIYYFHLIGPPFWFSKLSFKQKY